MAIRSSNLVGGFLATVALPLLALADAILAHARGWLPLGAGQYLLPVLTGIVLVAASSLALPAARRFYRRSTPQILVVSASLFLALLVAEMILAFRFPVPVDEFLYHLRTPYAVRTFRPDPDVMPGVSGVSRYRINSFGVRGGEPPAGARYHILCVGGSTTECLYLDDAETWPRLLQERLTASWGETVWVGNAGFSGYTTSEHLEFLENSPLVPRMDCLIFLVGVNDFARALMETEPPRPFFHARMRIKPRLLTSNLSNLVSASVQSLRHSLVGSRIEVEDPVGQSYVQRRKRRKQSEKSESLADLQSALAGFDSRLEGIFAVCRTRGVQILFVTQPVLWNPTMSAGELDLLWMGEAKDGSFLHHRELRRGMDLYNEVLVSFAARRGVASVDLEDMSGDARFYYDDCHFNEAGAAETARRIAGGVSELRRALE